MLSKSASVQVRLCFDILVLSSSQEACEGVKTLGMRFQATKGATFVKAKSSVGDELE